MEENTAIEIENARESIRQTAEVLLETGIPSPLLGLSVSGQGPSFDNTIVGDDGDNEFIINNGSSDIFGGAGNDTIAAFGGNTINIIRGGAGNDSIIGGDSIDIILGNDLGESETGIADNDTIIGGDNVDIIFADAGNDRLEGNGGDDYLFGDAGNDLIIGGSGNDIIAGVNIESIGSEAGEIDTLVGGAGSDLFWLGGAEDYLYDDGVQSGFPDFGTGDYASIQDFSKSEDVIQLNGSAEQYITIATYFINADLPSGTGIFREESGFLSYDLVAVVEGIDPSQLSLTDTGQFSYV